MKVAKRISQKTFNRLVLVTTIVVYLVILAGGIVRSTGSGMGCPDWPKCFGSWVPPTAEAQLPADYRESFAESRVKKNLRLARYLETLGFNNLASELQAEHIAAPEEAFNTYKTWTEYINRLLGVLLGLLIVAMTVVSLGFRKNQPVIFYGSLAALILVVFQGWIGSVVVSTNLLPGMVTFHMALAALLIGVLIYLFHTSMPQIKSIRISKSSIISGLLITSMALFFIQIAVGSQVREAIDLVALQVAREQWIANLGGSFFFHRSFSLLLLAIAGTLVVMLRRVGHEDLSFWSGWLFLMVVGEIFLGVIMSYFGVPAWAQPLHLLLSLMILGLQFYLYLKLKRLSTV